MAQAIAGSVDEARAYWTRQAELAYEFMIAMRTYPLTECGENMASLLDAADGLDVEFASSLLGGLFPHQFFLREGLIPNFRKAARLFHERGWRIRVEDAYRTPEMQRGLSRSTVFFDKVLQTVMWELKGALPDPEFMFRRVSVMIATRSRVGTHVAGSAIDVSVIDRETGREIDRGAPFPEISERTPMASPFVTPEQRRNRDEIEGLFLACDFHAYPYEFWHFNSGDCFAAYLTKSGRPGRYGPIVFDHGKKIRAIGQDEADTPLEPIAFYEKQIQASLERLGNSVKS
jgi:D-alanyl-D-alanine dipeptidase